MNVLIFITNLKIQIISWPIYFEGIHVYNIFILYTQMFYNVAQTTKSKQALKNFNELI